MNETFFGGSPASDEDPEATTEAVASVSQNEGEAGGSDATEADVPEGEDTVGQAQGEPADIDSPGADETATSVAQAVMPAFGLVRVEPDGSAVIAGSATPSGEVEIYANNEIIGTEVAEPSGDWAFVTSEPLATGGVELRVRDVQADQYAGESVVVVVQDDRTSEPLVVASEPGEASEILQGLEPVEVAEAEPEPELEIEPATRAESADDRATASDETPAPENAEVDTPAQETPEPAESIAVAQAEVAENTEDAPATNVAERQGEATQEEASEASLAPEPSEPSMQSETTAPGVDTSSLPQAPEPEPEPEQTPLVVADALPESSSEPDDGASSAPELAADTQQEVPADQNATQSEPEVPEEQNETVADLSLPDIQDTTPQPAIATVPPTIDAVEIDGDRNFFAGSGQDGAIVRLYVDNQPVGTAQVADGRWLVEAIGVLDQPSQRVRIDMLDDDGGVIGRAEVNFVLEVPEPIEDDNLAVAQAPEPQSAPSGVDQAELESQTPESVDSAEPEVPAEPTAGNTSQDVSAQSATQTPVSGDTPSSAPSPAAPQQAPQPAPETGPATTPGTPEEPGANPVAPVQPSADADTQIASTSADDTTATTTAPSPSAEQGEVPTMVGVTEGDRTTSGLAIIRRGDNLWTIARRVYGEGIRYTQIFEANDDQIRDPDLIYPGQVFDLPGTDAVLGEDELASQ